MVYRIPVDTDEPFDVYISNSTGEMIMTILESDTYKNISIGYSTDKPVNQLFTNLTSTTGGLWSVFQDDCVSIMSKVGERLCSNNRFEMFQKGGVI